jgi:hypothetical protein
MTGEEGHHGRHGKHGRYGDRHRLTGRCGALLNAGWSDEARAASLDVRRAKAAKRKKADAKWEAEQRKKKREKMFDRQREVAGKQFIESWYPRGRDGRNEDPHIGRTGPEAPYGYVDGTADPRKEPLYDRFGRAIIPRLKDDWFPQELNLFPWQQEARSNIVRAHQAENKAAEKLWGAFGKKKRWMDDHPGATDADWKAHDQKRYDEWKRKNPRGKKGSGGGKGK